MILHLVTRIVDYKKKTRSREEKISIILSYDLKALKATEFSI